MRTPLSLRRSASRAVAAAALAAALLPAPAAAQRLPLPSPDLTAGSDLERYLRALQITGRAEWYPWSIRGFSRRELLLMLCSDTLAAHAECEGARSGASASLRTTAIGNTAYPYGWNNGAVWAGRGVTLAAAPGVALHAGPLSVTLNPVGFWASNTEFPLLDNGRLGAGAFNHGLHSAIVDNPQRFGDEPYARLDPGNSSIRLDTQLLTAGASTANMWWGPGMEHAFVLSNNAPGFPHVFVGTGSPLNIGLGRLHGRVVWGTLAQSEYSPVFGSRRYRSHVEPGRDRLMAGLVLVYLPRPIPRLELGLARFSHRAFPETGISRDFLRAPFAGLFQQSYDLAASDPNDLASVFARWTFPRGGFEVYGEYGREDHAYDRRELIQDPEHQRSFALGFQKTFSGTSGPLHVLRGEHFSFLLHPSARDRLEAPLYTHHSRPQGHTNRGQLLGSYAGVGNAGGTVLAVDRYGERSTTTVLMRRVVRAQNGFFFEDGVRNFRSTDLIQAFGVEHSRTFGRLTAGIAAEIGHNFNRNFDHDATNVHLRYEMRWFLP